MEFLKKLSERNNNLYGTGPVTAAFLGDSVTHGSFEIFMAGDNRIDALYDHENVYHARFRKMLNQLYPAVPLNIVNAGIGGDSAPNGLKRLERDVLRFSPDLVVVCYGLNDAHKGVEKVGEYADALRGVFRRLKEEKIETVFLTPNMMNTRVSPLIKDQFLIDLAVKCAGLQNDGVMDAYMQCAKEVCAEEGVPVCDCYKIWKQLDRCGVDVTALLANHLNHPTREMHGLFAQALLDTLLM